MAAAFAAPMTTSSLFQAIRECGLAQLLLCASAEERECAAHSGLLQATCLALRSEDASAWAPATEVLAILTENATLGKRWIIGLSGEGKDIMAACFVFESNCQRRTSGFPMKLPRLVSIFVEQGKDTSQGVEAFWGSHSFKSLLNLSGRKSDFRFLPAKSSFSFFTVLPAFPNL
jgi:hypothetical protein